MSDSDFIFVTKEHRLLAQAQTVWVERKPTQTEAIFLDSGHYRIMTSNGESTCEGPVWILWDTSGYPYPITPEEFERLYKRVES